MQPRSIAELLVGRSVFPEVGPPQSTIHSKRSPQAMCGSGLMDAIPDATILAGAITRGGLFLLAEECTTPGLGARGMPPWGVPPIGG